MAIRKAADDLGMPYRTLHGWLRAARRSRRKPVQKAVPMLKADLEARVRGLEAEDRKLLLKRDILEMRWRISRRSIREVRLHPRRAGGCVHGTYGVPPARSDP